MRLLLCVLLLGTVILRPALAMTEIQEVISPQGHVAWLVEDQSIPMVAMEFRFKGGATLDPGNKAGATQLMIRLLDEGAGDLDATAYAETFEALASQVSFYASDETVGLSMLSLRENLEQTVDLTLLALREPRFDAAPMDRIRARTLARLQAAQTQPGDLAWRRFSKIVHGDHPVGRRVSGTAETLTNLTRQDLLDARIRAFATDRVSIGVVGAITAVELAPMLDRILQDLPSQGPALPEPARVTADGSTHVIALPGPQSLAIFGHQGLALEDPDFYPAFVLNHILGGSFSSRLTQEIREERGLTYGVGTSLSNGRLSNLLTGSIRSGNATMAEALDLIRAIWSDLAANGVTQDELQSAKQYLTGEYALRFDGSMRIAGILVGLQAQGRPRDFITRRNALVEAVTLSDIRRVAARLLDTDALTFVVVGTPDGVEATAD